VATILIVDDEPNIRRMVGALLAGEGHHVIDAPGGAQGIARAEKDDPDVVLLDLMMPGAIDGMATLQRLKEKHADLPVIMMSGRAGLSDAVKATKLGAINFLEKPLTPEGVLFAIGAALELRQTRRVARELREELGLAGDMVGESVQMKRVDELIARVAASDARVLITGESGTGKELVASAIHDASTRRDRPFVRVNCAAIPRDLVESEMFGHEKGAFTGATQTRIGRFELANTGTLFLDEVGDLSADAQAKLLRAIEAREIQRVGSSHPVKVDVRIIAATNHDLERAVLNGRFRDDLFFRLNVIPLALPPLREREGDVPLLVRHFSLMHFKRTRQLPPAWTPGALDAMQRYPWPGNVRELANIVERLSIMQPGAEVTAARVQDVLRPAGSTESDSASRQWGFTEEPSLTTEAERRGTSSTKSASLNDALDDYERRLIQRAIDGARGNIAEAARRLQTDRPNLYRRMKRLGIGQSEEAIASGEPQ
jgi:two-component system nitrogen regulation response regulator NtrX